MSAVRADDRHGDVHGEARARDRAARRLARREFGRPVVLEAGAGTGKTTTLVARVVTWLVEPGWERAAGVGDARTGLDAVATRALSGLVAITFTEAAAADMDHKIRAGLALVEAGGAPIGMETDEFHVDESTRRARAAALRRALERPIAQTIHSFCAALLQRHALEAGLRPGFEVDATGRVVRDHARAVVADALARARADGRLEDWIVLAQRELGPSAVAEALETLIVGGERAEDLARETFPPGALRALETDLAGAVRTFLAEVGPALAAVPPSRSKYAPLLVERLTEVERRLAEPVDDAASVSRRIRELVDVVDDPVKKRLRQYARGEFGVRELGSLGADSERVQAQAAVLDDAWVRHVALDPELERAARRILHAALADARARLVREGIETFGDLLRDAADLLERDDAVRRRLRAEYATLLVDEFQDTDPIQCRIVAALALGEDPLPRPNLLVVGDPKQSIYGFRSADLAAYQAFTARMRAAGGAEESLTLNFRSLPPVLEHVNDVIAPVMRPEEGFQPAFQPLIPHRDTGEARIEIWNTWTYAGDKGDGLVGSAAETTRIEATRLARELVRSRARGRAWKDMAVLLRTTSAIDVYLDALRDLGVPFEVAGDRSYYRRREVVDLAALLGVVADPLDHVALVAFLRSPYVGVPDAWLAPLWNAGFPDALAHLDDAAPESLARVRDTVRAARASAPSDVPGLDALTHVDAALDHALEALAHVRGVFAREPIDVFLERARTLFLIEPTAAARYQGRFRLANVARFLREVEGEMARTGGDAEALLRFLRTTLADATETPEARPRETASDAVSVMTIHKSKGLDFHEVFVVGANRRAGGPRGRARVTACAAGAHVLLGAPSPGWHDVLARRERREEAESIRLLYVALTRAKDRVVLSAAVPRPHSKKTSDDGEGYTKASGLWAHVTLPAAARAYFDDWKSSGRAPELVVGRVHYVVAQADEAEPLPTLASAVAEAELVPPDVIRRDADALARHRADAARRMSVAARVRMSGASVDDPERRRARRTEDVEDVHDALDADSEASVDVQLEVDVPAAHPPRPRPAASTARLVGTLVHDALARLSQPDADAPAPVTETAWRAALARVRADLPTAARRILARVPAGAAPHPSPAEIARAAAGLLAAFADGPAGAHARRVAPHVVACEFPLVAAVPAADLADAEAIATGSVDLLWRDPSDGRFVVVDYKTDDVRDDAALAARVAHHRPQVDAYRRALAHALALPAMPRGELWFLGPSRVVRLDEEPAARSTGREAP